MLGSPQRTNSLPVTAALSPDGKYLALLNNGFGSAESNYQQSIAMLDLATNQLRDFPDARLGPHARQTYFLGLGLERRWQPNSMPRWRRSPIPRARKPKSTGNGIAVYRFADGSI